MSRSFDEELGSRLRDFESDPAPGAKEEIFVNLPVPLSGGYNLWQMLGAVMMALGLLQLLLPVKGELSTSPEAQVNIRGSEIPVDSRVSAVGDSVMFDMLPDNPTYDRSMKQGLSVSSTKGQFQNRESRRQEVVYVPFKYQRPEFERLTLQSPQLGFTSPFVPLQLSGSLLASTLPVKETKGHPFFYPYFDFGLFFVYQQLRPNLSDDLIVQNLQGAGRFSPRRLGLFVEAGVRRPLSESLHLLVGGSFNRYRLSYRFEVRDNIPQSAIVRASEQVSVEPVFDRTIVDFSAPLWLGGLKAALNWYLLPNHTSSLYLALEYNLVLNGTHHFFVDDQRYRIAYPDQWLIDIGLRKTLFKGSHHEVSVVPNIRYSWIRLDPDPTAALSAKPFSAGLTISYLLGSASK